ncbi:MAG: TolC family protein [Candidatus Eremiobacteraeota bacterium]|nr:TolC family protein [Candidatus Eremiobacteraeota bacterium]
MRCIALALSCVAFCYGPLAAAESTRGASRTSLAPPPSLTLLEAERLALEHHPDIKASLFDEFAAGEAVKIARAGYEPQAYGEAVQAFASGGTRIAAYNAITDPTIIQRTALGVGITQYITDFGRTGDLVQAAEFDVRARSAVANRTRDTVLLDVTQAYFDVLRANALLVVANQTSAERHTLFRQASALQRAGLRSTLDVAIAERDAASADQLVLEGLNRRLDAFAELTEAIGSANYNIYRLADISTLPPVPPNFQALAAAAERNNPTVLEARAAGQAATARVLAAGRLSSPTVSGYGFFGASPFRESNVALPSPYAAGGVNFTLPIFTGGSIRAQKREAGDEAAAASAAAVAARNRLIRDVRVAYEDVKTTRGNVDLSLRILRTADEALHDTNVRYRIGLSSIVDVSQAELERTQAAISETNARYDYILREADLEFAAGVIAAGLPQPSSYRLRRELRFF